MQPKVDVGPEHLAIVRQILQKHLSASAKVWVFGSRARVAKKLYSDLDLAIDAGQPLAAEIITDLTFDFEESDLPYKVDIVDWQTISSEFKTLIEKEKVLIWPAGCI